MPLFDLVTLRGFFVLLYGTWLVSYCYLTLHHFPSSNRFLRQLQPQRGQHIDVTKPSRCDVPSDPSAADTRDDNEVASNEDSSLLVIATVPYDEDHVRALWSQLECFTDGIDVVVLSAPLGSEAILEPLRDELLRVLRHLSDVKVYYFENNRYDVGLWCDALSTLGYSNATAVPFDNTMLLNDSVFAIRHFGGILDALRKHRDKKLVGLSYSNTHGYWLESVFRGFNGAGILPFMTFSCSPGPDDRSFGPRYQAQYRKKRAIVSHHEIPLARQYPANATMGLFSSDVPDGWPDQYELGKSPTWVQNEAVWRFLKDEQFFPVAKVNQEYAKACGVSMCTSKLSAGFLRSIDFGFPGPSVKSV